jgi:GDP-4-dehydro-6-deoxy-D-mannose reductase
MSDLLVTGLRGFVGSHLAERGGMVDLLLEGRRVDLEDEAAVHAAVARIRPRAVIHLAAVSSLGQAWRDEDHTLRVNFGGTHHLLKALRAAGFTGRMLYVSSAEVYGSVAAESLPVSETQPLRPRNPYAVAKVASEALCYQWSQSGPFEIVIARPFNHIGPRQRPDFAVSDFARQAIAFRRGVGSPVLKVGDVDATRDFTDVRDIAQAYLALLDAGANGEAYNVCSGIERSMRELIDGLFDASGVRMPLQVAPDRMRAPGQRRMQGDNRKLAQRTGWTPGIPIARTLADIVDDWESRTAATDDRT